MPRDTGEILDEQNRYIDSLVAGFEKELQGIVASAQAHTLAELQKRLTVTDGRIERTPANQRALRQVDDFFRESMDRAGYGQLSEEFVKSFNGQMPYFREMLDAISAEIKEPLQVKFTKEDKDVFTSQQISAVENLGAVVDGVAAAAKKEALLSIGALKFSDLAQTIAARFNRTIGEASTLAETSMVMFYRTITDRGFEQIESGLPKGAVKYRYEGPNDKLTRPFCVRTLERKPMDRAAIGKLHNGQLPDVFITGGGFNCRHQWIIVSLGDLPKAKKNTKQESVNPSSDFRAQSEELKQQMVKGFGSPNSSTAAVANKQTVMRELASSLRGNPDFERLAGTIGTHGFAAKDKTENAVAHLVRQWAGTSSNENEYSLALQLAAEKEFNLKPWKPFRDRETWTRAERLYQDHGPGLRVFLRTQYDQTQKWFADRDVSSVHVFRGMKEVRRAIRGARMSRGAVPLQPMSSFTADLSMAHSFAGYAEGAGTVLITEVPVSRVASMCRTGFGCLEESEIVVLSGPGKVFEFSWPRGSKIPTGRKEFMDLLEALAGKKGESK